MTTKPLNRLDTDTLLERKQGLVGQVAAMLKDLGLPVGYPYDVMVDARKSGLDEVRYIRLLELLLEVEAIKYTLCARLLPHVSENEDGV